MPNEFGWVYIKYMLGQGADEDWTEFNDSIIQLSETLIPGNATADDYDLSPFL